MPKKDYYEILGVEKNAPQEKIKEAYRKLAHKHHPDKAGGDEKKFKEINEAYQILSSAEKRAQYDRFGHAFDHANFGGQNPFANGENPFAGFGFDFNFGDGGTNYDNLSGFGDIFDAFFEGLGIKKKRRAYSRGADLEITQEITLEDAFRGVNKKINFETFAVCSKCGGMGYFEKQGITECSACDGRGEIQETKRGFFGNFSQIKQCHKCFGSGKIPNKLCDTCSGKGRTKQEKNIEIHIAPGTANGQLIQVAGAGEAGERGTESGDLYIRVMIKPHHYFARINDDLLVKKDLNMMDILMDKKIEMPTIAGGKINVEIPENFNFRERLRIDGQGMPKLGSHRRGDLYVEFNVRAPKKMNAKAKKILEDLEKNDLY